MRKFVLAAVLAASAPIAALTPAVAHADDASMYNLFVLGKMDVKSSDVEGRVAVAGDTKLDSYSVGALAPANTVNLVVGGNLTAGVNGGGATHGLTIVGGTATYHNWSSAGLQPAGTPLPVDFAAEQTRLYALTDALDAYAVTGTVTSAWAGQLTLSGSSAGLNVFDVSGATLAQLNTLNIDLTGGGTARSTSTGPTTPSPTPASSSTGRSRATTPTPPACCSTSPTRPSSPSPGSTWRAQCWRRTPTTKAAGAC